MAHGAVVGSALVSLIDRHQGAAGLAEAVSALVTDLKTATLDQSGAERDVV